MTAPAPHDGQVAPEPGLPTDRLAHRARHGDAASYGEVYGRVAPAVYAWACLHIRPALRARLGPDDLLQEVACRAWERFDTWDEQRGSFRAWIFGIARHVLLQAFERMAIESGVRGARDAGGAQALATEHLAALPDTATSITRAVGRDEIVKRFVARVERLPDDERRLLVYRGLEGLSHEQVSGLLSSTPDAVAKRWQRLRNQLREEKEWEEFVAA